MKTKLLLLLSISFTVSIFSQELKCEEGTFIFKQKDDEFHFMLAKAGYIYPVNNVYGLFTLLKEENIPNLKAKERDNYSFYLINTDNKTNTIVHFEYPKTNASISICYSDLLRQISPFLNNTVSSTEIISNDSLTLITFSTVEIEKTITEEISEAQTEKTWVLNDRSIISFEKTKNKIDAYGIVTIQIIVNVDGKVVDTEFRADESTTEHAALVTQSMKEAEKITFDRNIYANEQQIGFVFFNYYR